MTSIQEALRRAAQGSHVEDFEDLLVAAAHTIDQVERERDALVQDLAVARGTTRATVRSDHGIRA
jgi:hypothetical protein